MYIVPIILFDQYSKHLRKKVFKYDLRINLAKLSGVSRCQCIFFSHMFNGLLLLGFVSRGTFQVKFKNVSIKKFPKAAFCGEEKWLYKVSEINFLPKLSGIF